MNLSAANYWRLAKVYPLERKPDEALYVTEQRRKERMRLHLAKERFGYLKSKTFARCGDHPQRGTIFTSENCSHLGYGY